MSTLSTLTTRSRRRGANAVEFALTLPVFLGMMFAVVDYGYVFMAQSVLDAAAMEGTRSGAITDPNLVADLETVSETRASAVAESVCLGSCTYSCTDQGDPPDREIVCDLVWTITPLVGFYPVPNQVKSKGRQLLEWQRAR